MHDDPAAFRFCPRCGEALERRLLKSTEPERLVCTGGAWARNSQPRPKQLEKAPVLPLALDNHFQFRKTIIFVNDPASYKPTLDQQDGKTIYTGAFSHWFNRAEVAKRIQAIKGDAAAVKDKVGSVKMESTK